MRQGKITLLQLAREAFEQVHDAAYWSDHNPRPPQGHDKDFETCRDPECVNRREFLVEPTRVSPERLVEIVTTRYVDLLADAGFVKGESNGR